MARLRLGGALKLAEKVGKASQSAQERDSLFMLKPSIRTVLSDLARFVRFTHSDISYCPLQTRGETAGVGGWGIGSEEDHR